MAGCPVIAFNASSIPEVIGSSDLLLDDITTETLREKLDLVTNPARREEIVREGIENTRRFSWDRMADEYMRLYDSILRLK